MGKAAERQVCMKVTHPDDPIKKVNKSLPGAVVPRAIFLISGSQKETLQILFTQVQFLIKHITKNTIVYLCCGVMVSLKQIRCVKAYFQFYGGKVPRRNGC